MDPQGFNEQRLTQYIEEFQRELNNLLNARSKKRKASERTA